MFEHENNFRHYSDEKNKDTTWISKTVLPDFSFTVVEKDFEKNKNFQEFFKK